MKPLGELVAGDIMTPAPVCAAPEQTLAAVEDILIEGRIGGCPVVQKGKLIGVISRSDIARVEVLMRSLDGEVSDAIHFTDEQADGFKHAAHPDFQGFRQRLDKLKVRDAMRDQVVTCAVSTPVAKIAREMVDQHIHRIVVVDGDRPVGIVSSLDLCALLAR